MKKKFCLITDWLDLYGGAERVVRIISDIYPIDVVYTLTDQRHENAKDLFFKGSPRIITTPLRLLGSKFRIAFPIHPFLMRFLKVSEDIDVIFSSSFNVAKGIKKTNKNQVHICYFQTRNFKYIEDNDSLKNYFGSLRYFMLPFINYLKKWDKRSAKNPDLFIANSKYTQQIIKAKYNRFSEVIYPPVDLSNFTFHAEKSDYFIAIGRFAPMKRFDLLIEAFNEMPNRKLILVGDGQLMHQFRRKANKNITFTGYLPSHKINDLLKKAKACVCVGIEDFGIAAVEAQSCGTPVVAYSVGGTAETIRDGETGVLFHTQTKQSIINSIKQVEEMDFDYHAIHQNSKKFSIERFKSEYKQIVDSFILNGPKFP